MFLVRKDYTLPLFVFGLSVCALVLVVIRSLDQLQLQTGTGTVNIFLEGEFRSSGVDNEGDAANKNTKQEKEIDLSLSSPQPSSSEFPRGRPPAPNPQTRHEIPDSYLHVTHREDVLNFVRAQCKKYNKITAEPGQARKPRMLMVPQNWREHMILYSSNPKTGSTSFKKWFCRIQGDTRPYAEVLNVHTASKYGKLADVYDMVQQNLSHPAQLADAVRSLYKVVAVRNPLTKLISGFRDKVLRRTPDGIKRYMLKMNPNLTAENSDAEKFAAFVEALLAGLMQNFHFTPQWDKMKICDFPYDMIMQTETTTQQIKEVQEHTNTTQFEFPGSRSEQGYDSVATVHLAHQFYSEVSPELMDRLYEFFKWDYILLGYSKLDNPNFPYLDLTQDIDKEFGSYIE